MAAAEEPGESEPLTGSGGPSTRMAWTSQPQESQDVEKGVISHESASVQKHNKHNTRHDRMVDFWSGLSEDERRQLGRVTEDTW